MFVEELPSLYDKQDGLSQNNEGIEEQENRYGNIDSYVYFVEGKNDEIDKKEVGEDVGASDYVSGEIAFI